MNLLVNPEIMEILRSRQGLAVDAKKAVSIAMCTTLLTQGMDFRWPSNQAAALYKIKQSQDRRDCRKAAAKRIDELAAR